MVNYRGCSSRLINKRPQTGHAHTGRTRDACFMGGTRSGVLGSAERSPHATTQALQPPGLTHANEVGFAPGDSRKSPPVPHSFIPNCRDGINYRRWCQGRKCTQVPDKSQEETPRGSPCSAPSTAAARLSLHWCDRLQRPSCKSFVTKQAHQHRHSPSQTVES